MPKLYLKEKKEIKNNPIKRFSREIIYGGLDGIITTFSVIAGFTGAQSNNTHVYAISTVLLFSFAKLFSDATSMALGNFLSERTEIKKFKKAHINKLIDNPISTSLATFISFIIFGLIPTIPYLYSKQLPYQTLFIYSVGLTLSSLILLGLVRFYITHERWYKGTLEVLVIGVVSAFIAYLVGTFFRA